MENLLSRIDHKHDWEVMNILEKNSILIDANGCYPRRRRGVHVDYLNVNMIMRLARRHREFKATEWCGQTYYYLPSNEHKLRKKLMKLVNSKG